MTGISKSPTFRSLKKLCYSVEKLFIKDITTTGAALINLSMLGAIPLVAKTACLASTKLITGITSQGALTTSLCYISNTLMNPLVLLFCVSALLARNAELPLSGGLTKMKSFEIAFTRVILSILFLIAGLPALFAATSLWIKFLFLLSTILALSGAIMSLVPLLKESEENMESVSNFFLKIRKFLQKIFAQIISTIPQLIKVLKGLIQRDKTKNQPIPQEMKKWTSSVLNIGGQIKEDVQDFFEGKKGRIETQGIHPFIAFLLGQNPTIPLGKNLAEALLEVQEEKKE